LLATDKDQTNLHKISCVQIIQNNQQQKYAKTIPTTLERVAGLGFCKIEVFLMNCIVPAASPMAMNLDENEQLLNSFGITIGKRKHPKNVIQV
jgi:hypothetical protein